MIKRVVEVPLRQVAEVREPGSIRLYASNLCCTHNWQPVGEKGTRRFACSRCGAECIRDGAGQIERYYRFAQRLGKTFGLDEDPWSAEMAARLAERRKGGR